MKRTAVMMAIVALAGCSAKTAPSAIRSPSAVASAASPSARTSAGASAAPASAPVTTTSSAAARSGAPVGTSAAAVPPRPGTYHYTQSGRAQAGPFSFTVDPEGTLAIGAPVADGTARKQQQERVYSSSWSQEQVLLFGSNAVSIAQLTSRFGSGAFVQEETCTPSHPLKAIALPLVVGSSWNDSATCNGKTITLSGKVLRTETRTVGGARVTTDVVHIVTRETGSGYDVTLDLTMWIARAYGLTVHATETGSGTVQGNSFTENLTEDLERLTPGP
ncbi:MAG: hypothetical protein ACXVQ7_06055 [Actinomycetota bacterium]